MPEQHRSDQGRCAKDKEERGVCADGDLAHVIGRPPTRLCATTVFRVNASVSWQDGWSPGRALATQSGDGVAADLRLV